MIPILVLLLILGWSSTLLAQTPFYQGKTISIIVGTKAGDVYDLYPRLLAEFLPKYSEVVCRSFTITPFYAREQNKLKPGGSL
jgi:hypothetical protein